MTTAREVRDNFRSYCVQNLKNALKSAISSNYLSSFKNSMHIAIKINYST